MQQTKRKYNVENMAENMAEKKAYDKRCRKTGGGQNYARQKADKKEGGKANAQHSRVIQTSILVKRPFHSLHGCARTFRRSFHFRHLHHWRP